MVCTAPISYRGHDALRKDLENLKAALVGSKAEDVFMPAVAPSGVGSNEFYRSNEEFLHAVGDALRTEYQAIIDAGFTLQIDDPWLTEVHSQDPSLSFAERRKIAEFFTSATMAMERASPRRAAGPSSSSPEVLAVWHRTDRS